MSLVHQGVLPDAFAEVSHFRSELYACLTVRCDALFELRDALLRTDGPMRTLFDLALAPEHRRGHGALYSGLNQGRIDTHGALFILSVKHERHSQPVLG
ncbi:transposase [Streptomyces lannensis]|uniref:transposase n=1 Tax=Streptomyces TaxID=1883 RepID=UPI003CD0B0A3